LKASGRLETRPSKAPEQPGGLRIAAIAVVSVVVLLAAAGVSAQLPLTSLKASGQSVSPVYEGWYKNADGTFTMSFGYYNRNTSEVVEVPVGPDNFVSPGERNQGQPSEFQPRRHWGVFGVKVPADFGKKEVLWTLKFRGASYAIPGMLHANWQIDALEGEAGSGNTPPVVKFSETGAEGRGPFGVTAGPMTASTGQPLAISVWASDDGKSPASVAARGRGAAPQVQLAWFKHQGPGAVTFKPATGRAAAAGEQVTTQATFAAAGNYIVRVRANDSSGVAGAGHAQCCWTNGFVKVTVK
jgi:hypothetical protein